MFNKIKVLDKLAASCRPATARQLSVVMGVSVIAGDLLAGAQVLEGIEFDSSIGNTDEHARLAGMVHELKGPAANAAVYGLRRTEFDNRNPFGTFGTASCFPHGDALAGKLPQLAPGLYRGVGEESRALNRTLSND